MEQKYVLADHLSGSEIRHMREILGMSRREFAAFANCSLRTLERWEQDDAEVSGPVVTLLEIMARDRNIPKRLEYPAETLRLRLIYRKDYYVCTVIDVDEPRREVRIQNYVKDPLLMAFGVNQSPTFEEYEEFLESRCFPSTRDKLKLELKRREIPFYDPLMIIEKTKGRMVEDDFWIEIVRMK